eukprot:TRINITY_DN33606_c0_g1_i1.p1 TRINITY_DN33606_c0_g1~~TRINITY_DN33606_c0_g1_i1.p1  ORF type:complete len:508 (-),score=75.59 TRINITY_DN33606_c0_g1_i1:774-2297(-)
MFTPSLDMVQGVALLIWLLTLQCGGVARQGITGTQGTHDWPNSRRDYLRETEDILSYEPFLGVADPPVENTRGGGVTSRHTPRLDHGMNDVVRDSSEPMFAGPIENVTVNVGREAVMECHVNNLRQYKVGWLKAGDQTILALHKRVITHNTRVSVSHEDSRIWKLHLRSVVEADRGCYMCQINTEQMKQQLGCLDVNVPPDIDYLKTSKDVVVQEGDNVTLVCKASGHPRPKITWRREDGQFIMRNPSRGKKGEKSYQGEHLNIARVGRGQMGAYLCIASNDVPPAVSKRISLNVNFAPEILVPNQLLGYQFGASVVAECLVEAYPNTINYWMKHQSEMLLNNDKYTVLEEKTTDYSARMQLQIKDFQESDVGVYTCISTNSLGKSDGTIRFYEIPPAERITAATHANKVTTTTFTQEIEIDLIDSRRKNKHKSDDYWLSSELDERGGRNRERGSGSRDSRKQNSAPNNNKRNYQSGFSSGSTRVGHDTALSLLNSLFIVLTLILTN